jgi:hypothetical protein
MQQPVRNVSAELRGGWKRTLIGTVEDSELFPLEFKTVVR